MPPEQWNFSLVVSDPDILGGDPVFRGTRVPVHLIAALLEYGSTEPDILKAYPRVTAKMVQMAQVYARVHPLLERARVQPWRDRLPVHRSRARLSQ